VALYDVSAMFPADYGVGIKIQSGIISSEEEQR
jgi:hypothetical protein